MSDGLMTIGALMREGSRDGVRQLKPELFLEGEPLDEATAGAQAGDLVVVMARPWVGKSYTLMHMALSAWQAGCSVLFVTMEMTPLQVVRRILGMYSGVNPDLIRRGMLSDRVYQLISSSAARLSKPCRWRAG